MSRLGVLVDYARFDEWKVGQRYVRRSDGSYEPAAFGGETCCGAPTINGWGLGAPGFASYACRWLPRRILTPGRVWCSLGVCDVCGRWAWFRPSPDDE